MNRLYCFISFWFSCHSLLFYVIVLVVSDKNLSLTCLTFTGTLYHLHFTRLFMFTSFRTILPFRISVLHLIVFNGALRHSIALPLPYGTPCQKKFDNTASLFQLSPSQFHKKFKTPFFRSFLFYLTLPPARTASLVFSLALCLSFMVIFICHSPPPRSLNFVLWTNLVHIVAKSTSIFYVKLSAAL
jgi:hypothetical protein